MTDMQILAMVSAAGDGAFTLAVLFILKDYFLYVMAFSFFIFIAIKIFNIICDYRKDISTDQRLADALGTFCPLDKNDKIKVIAIIKDYMSKRNER